MKTYQVLNGDALEYRFPETISGERVVARLCMIDGPVTGDHLEEVFANRISFMLNTYEVSKEEYTDKSIGALSRLDKLNEGDEVCLWFEDDLFCQANFWFCLFYIDSLKAACQNISLIRCTASLAYGFAGMDDQALLSAYTNRTTLRQEELRAFKKLWRAYQQLDIKAMYDIARGDLRSFDFLEPAIRALDLWKSPKLMKGSPIQILTELIDEYGSEDFGRIYGLFHNRLPIYGFGDWQVKKMFTEIIGQ